MLLLLILLQILLKRLCDGTPVSERLFFFFLCHQDNHDGEEVWTGIVGEGGGVMDEASTLSRQSALTVA